MFPCGTFKLWTHLVTQGIYPREPRNKKKASKSSTPSTTFYYTRDIQYLLHEPLLNKFREHSALAKKVSRALGKGEVSDAARLERTHTPRVTLDHIIKERYPTFQDALRDLDDALSMLFLFANLPSTSSVLPRTIALCQRLCMEFEHYLITTHSMRKSFLSIKGIYYQATIDGQDILWLVPYKFVQRVTNDVDFRIMGTFVEFYTALLGFVNFRLYTSVGLVYPPKFDPKSDEGGGELDAFAPQSKGGHDSQQPERDELPASVQHVNGDNTAENQEANQKAQSLADAIASQSRPDQHNPPTEHSLSDSEDEDEDEQPLVENTFPTPLVRPDIPENSTTLIPQPAPSSRALSVTASKLFKPYTFYLSRETPRAPLEFLLKAFGCHRVGWDAVSGAGAFTIHEGDERITHQIVDRPPLPSAPDEVGSDLIEQSTPKTANFAAGRRVLGRTYVQPQWIWDCVNAGRLLRPDLYAPGATLPPHLSPFVKPKGSRPEYVPDDPLARGQRDELADALEVDVEEGSDNNVEFANGVADGGATEAEEDKPENADADWSGFSSAEEDNDGGKLKTKGTPAHQASPNAVTENGAFEGREQSDSSDSDSEDRYQRELALEAAGVPASKWPSSSQQTKADSQQPQKQSRRRSTSKQQKEKQEWELERRKMMMPRRKRKLYEKMVYSDRKREEEVERLMEKKRRRMAS